MSVAAAPLGDGEPDDGRRRGRRASSRSSPARASSRAGARACEADAPVALSSKRPTSARLFWTYGFRGRPARPTVEVLGDLIDASSVGGGTFDLGSATFDMTRVVTGQLDAYVEPGPRLIEEVPGMRAEFERVGGGQRPQQLALRPGGRRPVPRGGRRGRHRRLRAAARRPAAARLGRRVPDERRRRGQRRAARAPDRRARSRDRAAATAALVLTDLSRGGATISARR